MTLASHFRMLSLDERRAVSKILNGTLHWFYKEIQSVSVKMKAASLSSQGFGDADFTIYRHGHGVLFIADHAGGAFAFLEATFDSYSRPRLRIHESDGVRKPPKQPLTDKAWEKLFKAALQSSSSMHIDAAEVAGEWLDMRPVFELRSRLRISLEIASEELDTLIRSRR